jgi:DHA1 family multidrug resistance protein-like MFS transporter
MEHAACTNRSGSWKRTLYIAFLAQFMASVGFSSTFPFMPLYVKQLGSATFLGTDFLIGAVYSAQAFTMMLASPFWGNLADRFGRKIMVERAMFGGAVIISLMGFVRNAEELVLLKAVQGAITGVFSAIAALVASTVPRERTGYAMGLLQVAMGSGISLGPLMGGVTADIWGYPMTFWITGSCLMLGGIVVAMGINEDFIPKSKEDHTPGILTSWKEVLRREGIIITYFMSFACRLGRMMMMPLLPFLAQSLLVDTSRLNSFTGLALGSAAVCMSLGASYAGRLGDRIGHRIVLAFCLVFGCIIYMLHGFAYESWHLVALQALLGLTFGGINPSVSALLARYSTTGQEGTVYGLDNSVFSAAFLVAPMMGVGCAAWLGVQPAFFVISVICLLSGLCAYFLLPGHPDTHKPAS